MDEPGAQERNPSAGIALLPTSLAVFVLALIPRLTPVWQGFITADEPFWVFSSIRFVRALQAHRWADTFQIGHPGVTTMWVGALGLWWQQWREAATTARHLAWIERVPWIAPENAQLFPHLAPFLPPARVVMAVLTSLGVVGAFALACRLWDRRVALAGAVLLALDPFVIGLSGLLHVDALAATFMTLGLLAWLLALQRVAHSSQALPKRGRASRISDLKGGLLAFLSGLCVGLGVLSKSLSAFVPAVLGAAAVLHLVLVPASRARMRYIALLGAIWVLGGAAAVFGAFPGMWVDPVGMTQRIYGLASRYGEASHRITFFRGVGGGDPGVSFYPTVVLYRLTPITLVGLALSLFPLLAGWRSASANRGRVTLASLWIMVVGFTATITLPAKKIDRYLLPVFPALDLLAAVGWMHAARWFYARLRPRRLSQGEGSAAQGPKRSVPSGVYAMVLVILLVAQGAMILAGWPYYLDVYNPAAGGMRGALHTLPVGWGEGLERVAEYLNRQPDAAKRVIAGSSPVTLGPLFAGEVLSLDESSRLLADYVLITALDRQIYPERAADLVSSSQLAHTVRAGGSEILWLYETQHLAEAEHLARYAAPGDIVVSDAPSPYARWASGREIELLDDADEAQVVELLNAWSATHSRLWYLAYPAASPLASAIVRRQLDAHAVRLDHIDLDYVTATLYILPKEPAFVLSEDPFRPARFGGQLAVVAGMLLHQPVTGSSGVQFRLRWRATAAPEANYMPFAHLVDQAGHLRTAGRGDELLVDERFWPTLFWLPGEGVELGYGLGIPSGLPPGRYWIVIGLTDVGTGRWIPVLDEGGAMTGTTAPVLPVDVFPDERMPGPEALKLPNAVDAAWDDRVRLLSYDHRRESSVGKTIYVELGWIALATMDEDYLVRLTLNSEDGEVAHVQTYALSTYPTSSWRAGELIHEIYDLKVPAELGAGSYTLAAQVLVPSVSGNSEEGESVPLGDPAALGSLAVAVEERLFELPQRPQFPLELRLGSSIALLGYDLPQPAIEAGGEVSLILYWRCEVPIEESYAVFAHLLDAGEQVRGQRDRVPLNGRAPTSGWVPGQIVVDELTIPVAASVEPGTLRIEVGMYDPRDMARLPIFDGNDDRLPGDRVLLSPEVNVSD